MAFRTSILAALALLAAPAASTAAVAGCDDVIVGGGWAGVYFAYRRAMAAADGNASSVCLFERSSRIGGRTYSVPVNGTEFTLDVGAYRFSPDMHLPGDLILGELELPTECYEVCLTPVLRVARRTTHRACRPCAPPRRYVPGAFVASASTATLFSFVAFPVRPRAGRRETRTRTLMLAHTLALSAHSRGVRRHVKGFASPLRRARAR